MTPPRYYLARFAQTFGYQRKNQRMGDAASEMHLLREAEAQLGFSIWEKIEKIEELSVEYWNLRKLTQEREIIQKNLTLYQGRLEQAHEERSSVLNRTPVIHQTLADHRITLLQSLEDFAKKRDQIVAEAREVRRSYDGMKTKLEVISMNAPNDHEIAGINVRLGELKEKFAKLKQQRIDIGNDIEAKDNQLDVLDQELDEKKKALRTHASEAFQIIGDGNKEIAILRAEFGVLESQMRQLYAEIGRYVSRNAQHDPACGKAAASHRGLIDIMKAIRLSIALNHRLAGTD